VGRESQAWGIGGGGGGKQASDVGTVRRLIPDLGCAGPLDPEGGIYLLKFLIKTSCYG